MGLCCEKNSKSSGWGTVCGEEFLLMGSRKDLFPSIAKGFSVYSNHILS